MQMILGIIVAIIAIYLLIKRYETRLVLFTAGLIMFIIALEPMGAFEAFTDAMGSSGLFIPITTVMGYSGVMKLTKSDDHLIFLLTRYLRKAGPLLIAGVTIATFIINTSLTSTSGISAAVGAIFIPLMVATGIHPAIAASAILLGTWGSFLNPGYPMNALTAEVSGEGVTTMSVVSNHVPTVIISMLVATAVLTILAVVRKENKGYEHLLNTELDLDNLDGFKVNYLKAILPLMPLIIIIVAGTGIIPGISEMNIGHAVLISLIIAVFVTRHDANEVSKSFFKGFGNAFGSIFGIIVTATVFTGGLQAVGIIDALIDIMISFPAIAKISAAAGPYAMALVTGSGEAATVAFNQAVTINAQQFGILPIDMGSVAGLAGALGRATSPLAGGAIILAGAGNVDTFDIAKRNILPTLAGVIVVVLILLYL